MMSKSEGGGTDVLKIAVCDDEKIFRDEIMEKIYDFFGKLDCECVEFAGGKELLAFFSGGERADAIFLDIEMPGRDGFETAKTLRDMGVEVPVIFLTSHTEMAMDGYEVSAFRFLGKPVREEKLNQALLDLRDFLTGGRRLVIRFEGEDVVIPVEDIIFVESRNNCVRIVLADREYTIREKLVSMQKKLEELSDTFFRIHRGYLVNLKHVKRHHLQEIVVEGDITLPLSRPAVSEFKKRLLIFVRGSAR